MGADVNAISARAISDDSGQQVDEEAGAAGSGFAEAADEDEWQQLPDWDALLHSA